MVKTEKLTSGPWQNKALDPQDHDETKENKFVLKEPEEDKDSISEDEHL